jgi:hypothetical protein
MVTELPPSRFKTMGSLASLRRLMGWQAPGLTCKVKSRAASLANMRPGDFVFFTAYALVGLVPPLSSFFLTLLEYYELQLQHLSSNSIALVAIFVHLYEMYLGVRPSVRLFRRFFVLKAASTLPPLIGSHNFQRRTPGHARYIMPVSLAGGNGGEKTGRWCRRTSTTGLHFLSVARPSTALSGGKILAWSQVSTPCWIRSSTWSKTA